MKITMIPVGGNAPTHYSFNGDVLTAYYNGASESFDLSSLVYGASFEGFDIDVLELEPGFVMRGAYRDDLGELHLILCQRVSAGHWQQGEEFDSTAYIPEKSQVIYNKGIEHHGVATVFTSLGEIEAEV